MKLAAGLILILAATTIIYFYVNRQTDKINNYSSSINPMDTSNVNNFILTSPAFAAAGAIPQKYTCDGANINPPLKISNAPAGTKSFALVMDDPDAPRGPWIHWVKWNIPPTTTEIAEGIEPPGRSGQGTGGQTNYQGPCPPDREHRYFFKLYALDRELNLTEGSGKNLLEKAMADHLLGQTTLFGRYNRQANQ